MNASIFRTTRFELRSLEQGPNHFRMVCSPREALPDVVTIDGKEVLRAKRTPPLDVPEQAFTDQEMSLVHAVLEMLENKFDAVYGEWASNHERLDDLVIQAVAAKDELKATTAAIEAARLEHAELTKSLDAMREAMGPGTTATFAPAATRTQEA